jgi:HSP20 family protein
LGYETTATRAQRENKSAGGKKVMSRSAARMVPMKRLGNWISDDPFRELFDLQSNINHLFDASFGKRAEQSAPIGSWTPAVDIYEDENSFLVKVELPEIERKDVKVSLHENTLSISGERRIENEDKREGYHRVERSYGQFYRSFTLPPNTNQDAIAAEFKDGVLRLAIPKKEEAKPKQIDVQIK